MYWVYLFCSLSLPTSLSHTLSLSLSPSIHFLSFPLSISPPAPMSTSCFSLHPLPSPPLPVFSHFDTEWDTVTSGTTVASLVPSGRLALYCSGFSAVSVLDVSNLGHFSVRSVSMFVAMETAGVNVHGHDMHNISSFYTLFYVTLFLVQCMIVIDCASFHLSVCCVGAHLRALSLKSPRPTQKRNCFGVVNVLKP